MRDSDALPLLLEVMAAAGRHDARACRELLDQAEATLPATGPHKSRHDIEAARIAVAAADWSVVWGRAYQATTGLTWAFPADVAVCPPAPGPLPHTADATCGCGEHLPAGARFCPACGARL